MINYNSIPYHFHDSVVLRTPLYPMHVGASAKDVLEFFKDPIPNEALYTASPVLFHQYQKYREGQAFPEKELEKLIFSLSRYYYRMHSRCTPFGLLATVSLVKWSDTGTDIVLDGLDSLNKKSRLDMYLVCLIQEHLLKQPEVLQGLIFYPNSSIYAVGEDLRYIEYSVKSELRTHQITSVNNSEYINLILQYCQQGARFKDIATMLAPYDIETEEAMEFLVQLAEAQVLVSELEPNITGGSFFKRILDTLKRIKAENNTPFIDAWVDVLAELDTLVESLDRQLTNSFEIHQRILSLLKDAGLEALETKISQSDTWRPLQAKTLDKGLQERFLMMLASLNKMQDYKMPDSWQTFIQKFSDRYEMQEIPLMMVLDDELGLGFGDSIHQDDNVATKDVVMPGNAGISTTEWTQQQSWFLNKLLDAFASRDYVLKISPKDFFDENLSWDFLPPSFSIIFRMVENDKYWIETVGNVSAANLNGRFAHLHEEMNKLLQDICQQEQKINDDIIFAEIIHLPGSRVGNILIRPAFRQHEISFLARCGVPAECQLSLNDLFVSVRNGRVMLRSKKLNKYIIPKLSTAHNYHYYTQPLYKFLCDLQTQDFRYFLTFTFSDLGNQLVFAPRVEMQEFILSPATWNFTNKMLEPIIKAANTEIRMREMRLIREQYKMPRYISLIEADIEMLVDTEDPLSVDVLVNDIKIRAQIVIREYLGPSESIVKDEQGRQYANQFISTVIRKTPVYTAASQQNVVNNPEKIQRKFIPGDAWLYYKIYAGTKTMDKLLTEVIYPMANYLKSNALIEKWFFIRYADPTDHIRLRFLNNNPEHFQKIHQLFSAQLRPHLDNESVWKIQMDTYERELERYGPDTIEISESIFEADSASTAYFLQQMNESGSSDIRWLWAMKSTALLLEFLGFENGQKTGLMLHLKQAFAREFKMEGNTLYLKQLSKKYRDQKELIQRFMGSSEEVAVNTSIPQFWIDCIAYHNRMMQPPCAALQRMAEQNKLDVSIESLASSYIHMKFNRLFPSYQRKHEMVLYDLLYQTLKAAQFMSPVF